MDFFLWERGSTGAQWAAAGIYLGPGLGLVAGVVLLQDTLDVRKHVPERFIAIHVDGTIHLESPVLRVVDIEALLDIGIKISAYHRLSQRWWWWRILHVVDDVSGWVDATPFGARHKDTIWALDVDHAVHHDTGASKSRGLLGGSREPIDNGPIFPAVGLRETVEDEVDDEVVGHEGVLVQVHLGLLREMW